MDLARLLAESLRRLRREAGLTQGEMARALGISRPTLNRLESASQNVTLRTLGQLCRALRCELGDLFQPGHARLRLPKRLRHVRN
ncbi:MAG: helix-turn-helix transcriptional regulator [Acidobacteria bacterium]|nr:helix-turn-helix transcriptional regulator [Acidobacteriota bacterium]